MKKKKATRELKMNRVEDIHIVTDRYVYNVQMARVSFFGLVEA